MRFPGGGAFVPPLHLDRELNGTDLRVAIWLGTSLDNLRWREVDQAALARELGKSRPTINASLQKLVSRGWVKEQRRAGLRTKIEYRFKLDVTEEDIAAIMADVGWADNGKQTMSVGPTSDVGEADRLAKTRTKSTSPDVDAADNDVGQANSPTPPKKKPTTPYAPKVPAEPLSLVPQTAQPPPKRGARLPETWRPSPQTRQWARATYQLSDAEIDWHVGEFHDYWRGVPGARGTKVDWDGTFRNRLRSEEKRGHLGRPKRGGQSGIGAVFAGLRSQLRTASAESDGDGGPLLDLQPIRRVGDD